MSAIPFIGRKTKNEHKIGIAGRLKLLVFKLTFGHIGGLAAVGGYFFLTQLLHGQHTTVGSSVIVFPDVKGVWDHLLDATVANGGVVNVMSHHDWNTIRHLVRPLYEGIFGGLLFALIAANPFKAKIKDTPPWLSRVAMKLRFIPTVYSPVTGVQIALLPLTVTLFSIPGVAFGYGVDAAVKAIFNVKSFAPTFAHPDVLQKFYTGAFDAKIIGLFASMFFAGRAARPVFYFTLRYYAQRRVLKGGKARFYHPPAFKLLLNDYAKQPRLDLVRKQGRHGTVVKLIVPLSAFVVLMSAGLGYYVLRFIAGP